MRLAVSMWSYVRAVREGRMNMTGFIEESKRIGVQGVELLDYFYQDLDADRAMIDRALEANDLPVAIFSVSQNFAKPDPEARRAQLAKIQFGVLEAKRYGAGVVRVFAGDVSEGITFDQARKWIVEGLAEASLFAAEHGVRLALENHGKLAGKGQQVFELIQDVRAWAGNDALGANPDTGNFVLVMEDSVAAVREVAPVAHMVHFKDFRRAPDHEGWAYTDLEGTKYLGTAIGEGDVDLAGCVAALREADFDGWVSIEYEGEEDPISAVARSAESSRRLLSVEN
jgi:sugar phosphate isomerase/epimerase